jgi:hypothetical protein
MFGSAHYGTQTPLSIPIDRGQQRFGQDHSESSHSARATCDSQLKENLEFLDAFAIRACFPSL